MDRKLANLRVRLTRRALRNYGIYKNTIIRKEQGFILTRILDEVETKTGGETYLQARKRLDLEFHARISAKSGG